MTRNRFFRFLSPPRSESALRRRRGLTALVAAAVVSNSVGLLAIPTAYAQTVNESSEIQQVVGKQLNGRRSTTSRSGGLLSGLFGGGSSSSSSGKSDEPFRKATPVPSDRDVNWQGIPTHSVSPSRTASRNTAPIQNPNASSRSTQPAERVARKTPSQVPTPRAMVESVPRKLETAKPSVPIASSRPEPLSATRSSRRAVEVTAKPSTPTKVISKVPSLVTKKSETMELVPKVSRKVIKSEPKTVTVAKSESASSRRAVPAPKKPEPPKVAKKPVAKPAPKAVAKAPVAKPAPTPAPVRAPAPKTVAAKPVAPAPKPQVAQAPPVQTPLNSMSKMTLGEARQSFGSISKVVPKQSAMTLPTGGNQVAASSQAQGTAKATLGQVTENAKSRMTTFGNGQGTARSGGSLASPANANANANGMALHPLSDRLPLGQVGSSAEAMKAQHDSQSVSHDGFAARSNEFNGREVKSPTSPNYAAAGYGYGQATPAAPATAATSAYPNAMRDTMAAPQAAAVPAAAVNSNTTSTELPGIRVMTNGPRNIMMRQTHPYEVIVENRGSVAAEGLLIRAHVPDWADVVGQQVSRGDVSADTSEAIRNLHWKIDRLEAGQSEKMFVRLKAARPGTHDLDVDWTMRPQTRRMQVTVQEPELALTIDGPDEVIYGHSKTYQIRVLNPGDGVAPDVVFTLSPKSSSPQSQRIGDIPAGKEAQFEVELTAQDLGELKIHGLAVGDLQLRAEADKTVRVLAADLEATLSGPELKYQNAEAVYQLQLTNHGTTASENVIANLTLPMGVSYEGGMEGATVTDNQLRWKIASLTPGAVRQYQFQCRMNSTGTQAFKFDCKGSAAGQTDVALETDVEAIADLVLSIEDPAAPAPIGQNVSYQIVIRNRGSKPATDVRAVAQFSNGIEPQEISGHAGKVITGQVLIEPISRIEAGEEVRMTIVAQAETSGHHRFRTEVRSGDTVLVAEEATHYLSPRNDRITRRSGPGGNEFSLPLR